MLGWYSSWSRGMRLAIVIVGGVLVACLLIVVGTLTGLLPSPAAPPTPTPLPTATPTPPGVSESIAVPATEEPTEEPIPGPTEGPEVGAAWGGIDDAPGTMFLGVCHGFNKQYTRIFPVPNELVEAAGWAYPHAPGLTGLVAMSNPLYIPRTGGDVAADSDTWLQSPDVPDCAQNPWDQGAVDAILGEEGTLGFFGIARPVTTEDGDAWELVFYAVAQ